MHKILSEYYRTPLFTRAVCHGESRTDEAGFFRFGPDIVCYGECSSGVSYSVESSALSDAAKASTITNSEIHLPFDVSHIIENLRMEHYVKQMGSGRRRVTHHALVRKAYYLVRERLPVWVRRHLQRAYFRDWQDLPFPHWPVDFTVDSLHEVFLRLAMQAQGCDKVPFIWFWPEGASGCLVLTHDVETAAGRNFTSALMDIDLSHGFKASFQVVPEKRYEVPDSYVNEIRSRGFEFNIHDLNHDGHLFEEKSEFLRRAKKINEYVKKYGARGHRSGAMYRNLDWYDAFEFSYDMSVPNVAHLEPQRGGCCTIMPYFVGKILEIPLTASQDYAIFHILNDYTIDLWKKQIGLIQQKNGLLSFVAHPDYLIDARCRRVYESLLAYLRGIIERDAVWATVPKEVDRWWRARAEMRLIQDGNGWQIEGPESERARIAYAALDGDRIVYTIGEPPPTSP
jgi:hypothetical protein